jgi:hypothetical protein
MVLVIDLTCIANSIVKIIGVPSQRASFSSPRPSDVGIQLSVVKEEEEKNPDKSSDQDNEAWKLVYKVSESPPTILTILFAMQVRSMTRTIQEGWWILFLFLFYYRQLNTYI